RGRGENLPDHPRPAKRAGAEHASIRVLGNAGQPASGFSSGDHYREGRAGWFHCGGAVPERVGLWALRARGGLFEPRSGGGLSGFRPERLLLSTTCSSFPTTATKSTFKRPTR